MAKNKPKSKLTVNDLVARDQTPTKSKDYSDEGIFKYDEELVNKLKDYNKGITTIDKTYSSLTPRFRVLVRAYVKDINEEELNMGGVMPIPVPSNSGKGNIGFTESPWPFTNKVIVVATPEGSDLKEGDILIYDKEVVVGIQGQGQNVMLKVNNAFVHPDHKNDYMSGYPIDPEDVNYGYLLVNDFDLTVKIN